MEFFLTPTYAALIVYLCGLAVAIVYLLVRPQRSRDTIQILSLLVTWFLAQSLVTGYEITHTHVLISGPTFEATPWITYFFWSSFGVFLMLLTRIIFAVGFQYHIWEERILIAFTAIVMLLMFVLYVFNLNDVGMLISMVRQLTAFYIATYCWLILAGARKLWFAYRTDQPRRSKRLVLMTIITSVAGLVFLLTTSYLSVVVALSAEIRGILPVLMALLLVGSLIVGYLLYGDEQHSLLVKLIGFLLVAYIIIFSIVVPVMRPEIGLRREYLNPDGKPTIVFRPDSLGGYRVQEVDPEWIDLRGQEFVLADDASTMVTSAFPVPFYGARYDSIWVGTNGSISFGQDIDADLVFSAGMSFFDPVPSAMPLYSDDIMAGIGAAIFIDPSPDRYLITWNSISNYDLHESTLTYQAALYPDGHIVFNYKDLTTIPLLNYVGISPGGPASPMTFSSVAYAGRAGEALFEYLDIRDAYRRFVHPLVLWALVVGIIGLFVLLFSGMLFYRTGILVPLERVLIGLKSVQEGNLDAEVVISERNELGFLADYFNSMTTSLREYSRKMEDLVAARTRELDKTIVNLRATQTQLVEQEKLASLGALTAGIAHEIKNPLNFVNNFAEVGGELMDELSEAVAAGNTEEVEVLIADLRDNAAQIAKHGRRADSIVKSMMQHARGGASDREEVELNTYLEEYIGLAWHGRRARDEDFQADVIREFGEDVGAVALQPQEFGRVILNLLNNAFDAVRETERAVVTVSTARTDADSITITVSDNGPGIPPEIREKIFEPFFTTKATGEGTGLGLSLSYDIITKAHGGSLSVDDSERGGALFSITIPIS